MDDGILFAPQAASRPQNKPKTVLDARQDNEEDLVEDEYEFDWQRTGREGKPPTRKRMLCFTLRRLMRLRELQSFKSLQEYSELFTADWCDLKQKGEDDFMADINSEEIARQRQRQLVRKVIMQMQMRQGEQSATNAFLVWKENTVLQQRMLRVKDITAQMLKRTAMAQDIQDDLKEQLAKTKKELQEQKQEYARNEAWLATQIKRIRISSTVSKNRSKAIGVAMRPILKRHKQRMVTCAFNKWLEHSKLISIHNLYREDMIANQDEFVYVTWQKRERHRLAMAYLDRAKKHAATVKRARQHEKEQMQLQSDQQNGAYARDGQCDQQQDQYSSTGYDVKSAFSFDPQKLAQPKTITYGKIHNTIVTLQQKFRKKRSERGSYLENHQQRDSADSEQRESFAEQARNQGSTGTAMFVNNNSSR